MRLAPVLVLALVGVAACGSSGSSYSTSSGAGAHTTSLAMSGSVFGPTLDTVSAGAVLTWTNHDGYAHTVTSATGGDVFDSGNIAASGTYQHTYNNPGTYTYYCKIHGTPSAGMRGTLVVQ